jgi:hypothetical protein
MNDPLVSEKSNGQPEGWPFLFWGNLENPYIR